MRLCFLLHMSESIARASSDTISENANVECNQGDQTDEGRIQSWKINVLLLHDGLPSTKRTVSISQWQFSPAISRVVSKTAEITTNSPSICGGDWKTENLVQFHRFIPKFRAKKASTGHFVEIFRVSHFKLGILKLTAPSEIASVAPGGVSCNEAVSNEAQTVRLISWTAFSCSVRGTNGRVLPRCGARINEEKYLCSISEPADSQTPLSIMTHSYTAILIEREKIRWNPFGM